MARKKSWEPGVAKKSSSLTQSERQQGMFQRERRGLGDGHEYVPGRARREMGPMGRLRRFACTRCGGRQIALSSDATLAAFLQEHWDPATCDLKEYYPLLDVAKTQQIAVSLDVRHPSLTDGSPAILITSLLVCRHIGGEYQWNAIDIASSRSTSCEPSAAQVIKAEYWLRAGVPYRIAHTDGLNSSRVKHLWDLFNVAEGILSRGLTDAEQNAQQAIVRRFRSGRDVTLIAVCHGAAAADGMSRAECVAAMRRLIALRMIECSLDVPELLAQPRREARLCVAEKLCESRPPAPVPRDRRPGALVQWKNQFMNNG
jgi:hypothetical protein